MTNLIRRLRAAWFFSRNFPVTQLPNDYWTNQDARWLSNALTSESGSKLRHIWLEKVNLSAQRAIMERNNSRYECGVAFGCRGMVAETDSLLILAPEQSESAQSADGDEAPFQSVNR